MTTTERRTRLAIAGELGALAVTGAASRSPAVRAFAVIITRRIRGLIDPADDGRSRRHPAWTEHDAAEFLNWARGAPPLRK